MRSRARGTTATPIERKRALTSTRPSFPHICPRSPFPPVSLDVAGVPLRDAALAAGLSEKVVAKAFKEGGKKGVEIEGAADTSGLTCFCTRMLSSNGDIRLLQAAMEGMNAVPDPADPEERKGCSGAIAKLIIPRTSRRRRSPWSRTCPRR